MPGPDRFNVRGIHGFAGTDIHTHVGQDGLRVRRREHDLRVGRPKPM